MSEAMFYTLFFGTIFYILIFCVVSECWSEKFSFCFNPKANYKYWNMLNWYGVWFFTILYWIVFLPFTIMALIYWIFTVGRKKE